MLRKNYLEKVEQVFGSTSNCNCNDSGCGTVDCEVVSETRRPRLESSHRQLLLDIYLPLIVCKKDINKGKAAVNGKFTNNFN